MATKFIDHFNRLFSAERTTVVATNVVAAMLSVVLVALAYFAEAMPTSHGVGINGLILVLGALVGWALAVSWVPFDDTEKTVYASIGAAVTAFVTGYAVSKFDRLLEATVYPAGVPSLPALVKVGLFIAALLLTAIVIVTNRVDWLSNEGKRQGKSADPLQPKPEVKPPGQVQP
jgi:drug/metabolite transporter (DMT)-like permease